MGKYQLPVIDFDIERLLLAAVYPGQKQACESLQEITNGVQAASVAVLKLQAAAIENVKTKPDGSPISAADEASHEILQSTLTALFPSIPIGGEEMDTEVTAGILQGARCWLIDGLDGTKEYIRRSADYAVCVGFLEVVDVGEPGKRLTPTFGIVSAPARGEIYFGGPGIGSYKKGANGIVQPIHISPNPTNVVFASQSHPNLMSDAYIAAHYPNARKEDRGSVYKLLMIAEGLADACPRLNVTMKGWDVAAGHAILAGAGGRLARPDGGPVDYRQMIIPDFVASR